MPENQLTDHDFLGQLTATIEKNISHESFGVSELADAMHMSRSNLLRKVKKETKLSVSQLISQVRLKKAMDLLRKSAMNVSEVSHEVGFNSTSYFIKCFREYYGYPPGEVGKRDVSEAAIPGTLPERNRNLIWIMAVAATVIAGGILFIYFPQAGAKRSVEKSIAVLPFKNDSNDSTNLYLINGLMESTLLNLQQIRDLKVISRTSAEKYRNSSVSIPELAKELNANYFVEGSGQKIGDKIVLNIQLIEGSSDRHLWGKQYRRETRDIFALQQEIATNIAAEIQAIITPEEEKRLEKIPTDNLEAYDIYLKGKAAMNYENTRPEKAVPYFREAFAKDPKFALAYANLAICYFYLDVYRKEKKYTEEIGALADKALLYDPKLAEGLLAKAYYLVQIKQYSEAVPFLEKALEYNPNSPDVIGFMSDFYTNVSPNTSKYLEYSLRAVRLNIGSSDSVTASYNYLRLANALIQTGFVNESLKYVDKSLDYNPKNFFSRYVKAFMLYAKNGDLGKTRELLIEEYNKDSSRLDILQDIGKVSYYLRDYKASYEYYKQFCEHREKYKLDIYRHENLLIGTVMEKAGDKKKAEELIQDFRAYIDTDQSIYKALGFAGYYAYRRDIKKSLEYYRQFSKEDNYQYWIVLFFKMDPSCDFMKDNPEFQEISRAIEKKFWDGHDRLKIMLEEKGLL